MDLRDVFPEPLRKLMPEFGMSYFEKRATCDNCLMARSAGGFAYKPHLKCCTFFPFLYNYQVGALLLEGTPEVQEKLEAFILTSQSQPLGVGADFGYQKKFLKRGIEFFGRDEELLCPYFDPKNSQCGIWKWRGGVCTSFYCESSYGIKGIEFWRNIEKYMLKIESILAYDALLNLGLNHQEAKACLDAVPARSQKAYQFKNELWLELGQDRKKFYRACFEYVSQVTPQQIETLLEQEYHELKTLLLTQAEGFAGT